MRVVKCKGSESHFFDGDTYDVCPICGAPASQGNTFGAFEEHVEPRVGKETTESLWDPPHYDPPVESNPTESLWDISPNPAPESWNVGVSTEPEYAPAESFGMPTDPGYAPATPVDSFAAPANPEYAPATPEFTYDTPNPDYAPMDSPGYTHFEYTDDVGVEAPAAESTPVTDAYPSEPVESFDDAPSFANPETSAVEVNYFSEGSLQDEILKRSSSDGGKTMSFFSTAIKEKNPEIETHADPVVGWVVCIEGSHLGEAFNIRSGMNSLGRNSSNAICLARDNSISRERHAFIAFEPKKKEYFLRPGDSSGLTYLNDECIMEPKKLTDRDIIELGNSKFMFIQLIGESFDWDEYIS